MPIDNHDKDIVHSLYGRKFGIDNRGFLTGCPDVRHGTETILTTALSTLAPGGTSILQATAAAVYELVPPSASMVGVQKRVIHNSTGAVNQLLKLSTANGGSFLTQAYSTMNTITMTTRGAYVDLEYISSSLVQVMLQSTSTANNAVGLTTTT